MVVGAADLTRTFVPGLNYVIMLGAGKRLIHSPPRLAHLPSLLRTPTFSGLGTSFETRSHIF